MVRVAVFLLIFVFNLPVYAADVCIVNSYSIPPAKFVEAKVRELLKQRNHRIVNSDCSVKILIGTPAVVNELEKKDNCRKVYTFVLFPEKFNLEKRRNFWGIRVFPLPEKTYKRFLRVLCLKKKGKVAVPVSRSMLPIARIYLPKKDFVIIPFNKSPVEIFRNLLKYSYVYVFPDPKLLKIVNLTTLVNFCKDNKLFVFSGLSDLSKFDLDYVDEIDYNKLAEKVVFLVEKSPEIKILPCPCRVK